MGEILTELSQGVVELVGTLLNMQPQSRNLARTLSLPMAKAARKPFLPCSVGSSLVAW